jgi:cephalosporin hydroxylase
MDGQSENGLGDVMSFIAKARRLGHRLAPCSSLPDPTKNQKCSEFEVDKWTVSEFVVRRLVPIVGVRPYPLDELLLMAAAICRFKPTHIFEWGTHIGKSARIFFEVTKGFGINTVIHSIDLPDDTRHLEHPGRKRGRLVKRIPEVILHQGDGLEESLKIWNTLRDANIKPLFFLDGDHEYASVSRELLGIMASVPNAVILVHDTFYQSAEAGYNTGPHKAIQDALESVPNQYRTISTTAGLPGLTLLFP